MIQLEATSSRKEKVLYVVFHATQVVYNLYRLQGPERYDKHVLTLGEMLRYSVI